MFAKHSSSFQVKKRIHKHLNQKSSFSLIHIPLYMLTMDTKIPYEYAHIWSLSVSSTHFLLQRWIYKSIYRYNNPHINL